MSKSHVNVQASMHVGALIEPNAKLGTSCDQFCLIAMINCLGVFGPGLYICARSESINVTTDAPSKVPSIRLHQFKK